ncbi:hypothetical protein DCAR_0933480 [Daucus carota subsp. sativus]|uniref:Uncharacterized protein n=1 Tax=Daucus carota subsp. sativus TaxID=79200 RepID=A0AAF0XWY1_DAUCS|nr:PREDICTED: uncharacterized protein LOC108202131 [Daucus carota subsp. sativus]WOH13966.1 hypothetical protein DCAR_0933480 [Daucus carota subsp. sativus]
MVNVKELCWIVLPLFMLLILFSGYIYYACREQGSYHRHVIVVTDRITALFSMIRSFIKNVSSELNRNKAEYLNVAHKLALVALSKSATGDADIWKVYWMTSFATFAICCYCLKLFVERKRAQLTPSSQSVTPPKTEKVLTTTNALDFIVLVSYLRLAFVYFMELNLKNHPSENIWKDLSYATKICIDVAGVLIILMIIIEIANTEQQVEDQSVADPPKAVLWAVKNQSVVVVMKDVKNPSNAEDADLLKVPIYIDDLESQLSADANKQKVALQIDGKNET